MRKREAGRGPHTFGCWVVAGNGLRGVDPEDRVAFDARERVLNKHKRNTLACIDNFEMVVPRRERKDGLRTKERPNKHEHDQSWWCVKALNERVENDTSRRVKTIVLL